MPDKQDNTLEPALRELESALGSLTPAGSDALGDAGIGGSAQRDQLMFNMGQVAARKRARRTHIGTALVALLVGTLVTLPWRMDSASPTPDMNNGQFVKSGDAGKNPGKHSSKNISKDASKKDTHTKDDPSSRQGVVAVNNDGSKVVALATWDFFNVWNRPSTPQPGDDLRYANMRDLVLEQGIDALPNARTGIAGGSLQTLGHRLGEDTESF